MASDSGWLRGKHGYRLRWAAVVVVAVAGIAVFAYASWAPVFAPTPGTISVLWDSQSPVAVGGQPHSAGFNGVSCPSAGACVAYGSDVARDGNTRPLLVTQHGQTWTPMTLPLPEGAKPSASSFPEVDADSCLQSKCLAVGDYKDVRGALHIFSNTFGWKDSTIELPLIGAAEKSSVRAPGPDKGARISLSCWSASGCMAAVTIGGSEMQNDAFELLRFDGRNWTPLPSPHIDLAAHTYGTDVDQISCTPRGWCAVVGYGANEMGTSVRAWVAVPDGKGWTTRLEPGLQENYGLSCNDADLCEALADKAKGDALVTVNKNGSTTEHDLPPDFNFYAFSCSPTVCAFSGDSETTGGYLGTRSATVTSTTSAHPDDKPLKIDANTCTTSSFCVAVGGYQLDPTGASVPLAEIFSNNSWKATTPSFPAGTVRGTLNGVACETPSHCVVIGQSNGTVEP